MHASFVAAVPGGPIGVMGHDRHKQHHAYSRYDDPYNRRLRVSYPVYGDDYYDEEEGRRGKDRMRDDESNAATEARMARFCKRLGMILLIIGWIIIIGYVIYLRCFGPTLSQRAYIIATNPNIQVTEVRPDGWYTQWVHYLAVKSGWADDTDFLTWYSQHTDRVVEKHGWFYNGKGGGHPDQYRFFQNDKPYSKYAGGGRAPAKTAKAVVI